VKFIVEVPDEAADAVEECIAWVENRGLLSDGVVLAITPGSDSREKHLAVRLLDLKLCV
jgi:hypothetical protein